MPFEAGVAPSSDALRPDGPVGGVTGSGSFEQFAQQVATCGALRMNLDFRAPTISTPRRPSDARTGLNGGGPSPLLRVACPVATGREQIHRRRLTSETQAPTFRQLDRCRPWQDCGGWHGRLAPLVLAYRLLLTVPGHGTACCVTGEARAGPAHVLRSGTGRMLGLPGRNGFSGPPGWPCSMDRAAFGRRCAMAPFSAGEAQDKPES